LKDYLNLGGLLLYTKERKYKDGYFNYLSGITGSLTTTILGKPEKYQSTLDDLVSRAKDDVDNLLTPPLAQVEQQNFPNAQIRKVKRKLKTMIDEIKDLNQGLSDQNETRKESNEIELKIVSHLKKIRDELQNQLN
jgi:predicted metal-dependent phosphoesterase TrpH